MTNHTVIDSTKLANKGIMIWVGCASRQKVNVFVSLQMLHRSFMIFAEIKSEMIDIICDLLICIAYWSFSGRSRKRINIL